MKKWWPTEKKVLECNLRQRVPSSMPDYAGFSNERDGSDLGYGARAFPTKHRQCRWLRGTNRSALIVKHVSSKSRSEVLQHVVSSLFSLPALSKLFAIDSPKRREGCVNQQSDGGIAVKIPSWNMRYASPMESGHEFLSSRKIRSLKSVAHKLLIGFDDLTFSASIARWTQFLSVVSSGTPKSNQHSSNSKNSDKLYIEIRTWHFHFSWHLSKEFTATFNLNAVPLRCSDELGG